jgi:hypothetical protein
MPRYRVLIPWTNDTGEHAPGDIVMLTRDSPAEEVEVDRLIAYKIVEPATLTADEAEAEQDTKDEPEPTRRRPAKK